MERKLAAIFSTDVAGYSRLMGDDEAATIRTLTAYREVISTLIFQHHGRVVDSPGDNLLAEFASAVEAVQAAVEIQQDLKSRNVELPDSRQMHYRIGINVGDVVVEGERLYGDGVNIAARLESLAIPGGICISGTVYDQVKSKLALRYEDLGPQTVKNIAEPVRVFRVVMDAAAATLAEQLVLRQAQHERTPSPVTLSLSKGDRHSWLRPALRWGTIGLVLLAATVGAIRYFSSAKLSPQDSALRTDVAPAALPLPDKPSLMVMPFVNMSKDPDQEYFSDGLTEVLTGDLSKISSLFVIARNSAFTYKGKAVKVQDVGREMGVRYILEGSVQKADQRVRITVQLIEAATGYHLWSEQYDRPLQDIFALQDEIVQKIVNTLKLQLTLEGGGVIERKHTNNLEAYDAFLHGVGQYHRFTKEDNAQAQQMLEKAVTLDPQYAEAYAWWGTACWLEWNLRWSTDPQILERALALARHAVALDDSLPMAHTALGLVYAEQQQPDQAIEEEERAVALDPNNDVSYARQALVLNWSGRTEESRQAIAQAMRLNPRYPFWYVFVLGQANLLSGRYDEAIAALKETISRNPDFLPPHDNLAVSYLLQWISQQSPPTQTLEPAEAAAQRALALNDSWHWSHITLGRIYLYRQRYEQALAEMERSVALAPTEACTYAGLAEVLSSMGRMEDALKATTQALQLKCEIADAHLAGVGAVYAIIGHYEEAVAPLRRYLRRSPNYLPSRLMLAAVYSELGQVAEAQKEAAEVLRLNPKFSLEVHKQRMPIKDSAVLERHIAALRKAGLK